MAGIDYKVCDLCSAPKIIYDADIDYGRVGEIKVLCKECSKKFTIKIVPLPLQDKEPINFKGWIAVRGENEEDMEEDYWFVTTKEFWEKNGYLDSKAPYIEIPNFHECMEYCYKCNENLLNQEQEYLLKSIGFEIRPVSEWR